jgi:peptidoglycan/xylan/chitin deacetylase (PgdA/CDA1 family)
VNIKKGILSIFILIVFGCQPNTGTKERKIALTEDEIEKESRLPNKPKVSFTFDDGITRDIATYKFKVWNRMILSALEEEGSTSVFFVTGRNKLDDKGKYLLKSWSEEGHLIANHTFTHPNFNSEKLSVADFEKELLKTDKVISAYSTYAKLFRFPYLKEGNTEEKITGFRSTLNKHGYKNGYVTIDASDWYIDGELIKSIQKEGYNSPKIQQYKKFYLQHILERANYYESLSYRMTGRNITHTLLLHHNLTSALFLKDLIKKFKNEGWEVLDANVAFQDKIFESIPKVNPAGESLIWSLAKESGKYEDELRYPAEDSRYEIPKMKNLGI